MSEKEAKYEFVPLNNFEDDYEILNIYPFTIRKKLTHQTMNEYNCNGYVIVSLNGNIQYKHRLIAKQFIKNDDPLTKMEIDHINQVKNDNRIENLRWVTRAENMHNRRPYRKASTPQKYEYVTALTGQNVFQLEEYNGHLYDRYWFDMDTETLYLYTRHKFKIVKPSLLNSILVVALVDVDNKHHTVSYNKLIREFKEMINAEN